MKHRLIVIDGLDGSGKQTQTERLTAALTERGYSVKHISFPDYNQPSSALVKMYLGGEFGKEPGDVNAYAASSFYAVDRFASYKKFWKDDYEAGAVILADRYVSSNAIYQMTKLPKEEWEAYLNWLEEYEFGRLQLPRPDCILYLDMPPEVSQKLMALRYHGDESKKDIHESHVEFLKQCRETAFYTAQRQNWNVIACARENAPRSIEEISEEVLQKVLEVI